MRKLWLNIMVLVVTLCNTRNRGGKLQAYRLPFLFCCNFFAVQSQFQVDHCRRQNLRIELQMIAEQKKLV